MEDEVRFVGRHAANPTAAWCAGALVAALAIGSLLLIPAGSGATEAEPAAEGAEETEVAPTVVLPVWAFADGDTPISGARVSVVGEGGPLEQASGAPLEETTAPRGAALLEFATLPRDFTVIVSGGSVRGEPLRGSLRAEVRDYRPPKVVNVSPVTTLIAEDREARERRGVNDSLRAATRGVERLLRIPAYLDDSELRWSDEFFDGDTFLERAGGGDGVARLIDRLVRVELRPGDPSRTFVDAGGGRPGGGGKPGAERVSARAVLSSDDVLKSFRWLSETATGSLADYLKLPPALQELLIGWVTAGWSSILGEDQEEIAKPEMVEIRAFFAKVDRQLVDLKTNMANLNLNVLVGLTNPTLGKIAEASNMLSLLASLPAKDPTKAGFAAELNDYVKGNLLDAAETLRHHLGTGAPLSDNVIKAASNAVANRDPFFDDQDSAAVESVFDYYAIYQSRLATILANYWHSKPSAFSGQAIKAGIDRIKANVEEQRSLLKPPVPHDTVVDRRTNLMWTQNFATIGNPVNASSFFRRDHKGGGNSGPLVTVYPKATNGPRSLPGGVPFDDWVLPSQENIEQLIVARGNQKAPHYLDKVARINQHQTDAAHGFAWMSRPDGWKPHTPVSIYDHYLDIRRYNLWDHNVNEQRIYWCPGAYEACRDELRRKLMEIKGATMYVRPVSERESYWWGD